MATTSLLGSTDSRYGNILYGALGSFSEYDADAFDEIVATDDARSNIRYVSGEDDIVATDEALANNQANCIDTIVADDEAVSLLVIFECADDLLVTDAAEGYGTEVVNDTIVTTDEAVWLGRLYGDSVDSLIVSDKAIKSRARSAGSVDTLLPNGDAARGSFILRPEAVDTIVTTDKLARETHYVTVVDTLVADDEATALHAHGRKIADLLSLADTTARAPGIIVREAGDTATPTDYATGRLPVTGFLLMVDPSRPSYLSYRLPQPELNNSENSINRFTRYRAENGKTYTYVNRTVQIRNYKYSFVTRYEMFRQVEQWLYARGTQRYIFIAWQADLFRVELKNTSLSAANVTARGDMYRFELEFEGIRTQYGGGRTKLCQSTT